MLIKSEVQCAEVPAPIEYSVCRPSDNNDSGLPLLYCLHGGGGSRDFLERVMPALEQAWADRVIPPLVAVTPSTSAKAFYMNLRDGSERWEDALTGSFL